MSCGAIRALTRDFELDSFWHHILEECYAMLCYAGLLDLDLGLPLHFNPFINVISHIAILINTLVLFIYDLGRGVQILLNIITFINLYDLIRGGATKRILAFSIYENIPFKAKR